MKSRMAIYVGTGAGVTLLWFFAAFSPMAKQEIVIEAKIAEGQANLDDYDRTMAELPGFLEKSKNLEEFKHDLTSSLYAKSDILDLIATLRHEAKTLGLTISEITPPVSELLRINRLANTPEIPQFLNLILKIKGNYVQYGKFVDRLEKATYFRGVNHCSASGSRNDGTEVVFSIGFRALLMSPRVKS